MNRRPLLFRHLLVGCALGGVCWLAACRKSNDPAGFGPNDQNTVTLAFANRVGPQALTLRSASYRNGAGEEFTVSAFNYFVCQVVLRRDNGPDVAFPGRYFLLRQADPASLTIRLDSVPAGNYRQLRFRLGVDSLRNLSDLSVQTGALDIRGYGDDNMYTGINYGFVILKLEGTSPAVPLQPDGTRRFSWLATGFGGGIRGHTPNNTRLITLTLPGDGATVRRDVAPVVNLQADLLRLFDGPNRLSLANTPLIYNPVSTQPLAENYRNLFSVAGVKNGN
jgi:hypothetical protein